MSTVARNLGALLILLFAAAIFFVTSQDEPVHSIGRRASQSGFQPVTARNAESELRHAVRSATSEEFALDDRETASSAQPARANSSAASTVVAQFSLPVEGRLDGRDALQHSLSCLEAGYEKLLKIPKYTAVFSKQERLNGNLQDEQVMQVKLRHKPFSVYMKWLVGDAGKEVLYVEGQHENRLLVKFGGWKARMIPTLFLEPDGTLALSEARYPITQFGFRPLVETLIGYRRHDVITNAPLVCEMTEAQDDWGRDCYRFVVEYTDSTKSDVYRKTVLYIDQQLLLPVCIRNYTWPGPHDTLVQPQLDESTLLEYYAYRDISTSPELSEADFDDANQGYRFQR